MKSFINSIYAGAMIAFGGAVYVSIPQNKYLGCFLFSLGLLTVVLRGFDLYTGKVGYMSLARTGALAALPTNLRIRPLYFPTIILGNFIGAWLVGTAATFTRFGAGLAKTAEGLVASKLADSPESIFLLSCACGVMMFLAVDGYRKSKNWLFVILPVMVFILSGFEHSIANMFYITAAGAWSVHALVWVFIMILGNGAGALAFRLFERNG